MTEKNPDKDKTITPAGEIELNEEELDQVAGGKAAFHGKIEIQEKSSTEKAEPPTRWKVEK